MLRILYIIAILIVLASCKQIKKYTFNQSEVVAEAGDAYLYKDEIGRASGRERVLRLVKL